MLRKVWVLFFSQRLGGYTLDTVDLLLPLPGIKRRSLVSAAQLGERDLIEELFECADYYDRTEEPDLMLAGARIKVWFYEASTRTRDMIETSVTRLGGKPFGPSDASRVSSAVKTGESIEDTMEIISCRATGIALRHPDNDAGRRAARVLEKFGVLLIDAGSGSHEHPLQAAKDLFAFRREFGRIDGLNIGVFGDLRNARTVRSLVILGSMVCHNITWHFYSQPELRISQDIRFRLSAHNVPFCEHANLEEMLRHVDCVYGLRLQRERFEDENEYLSLARTYPQISRELAQRYPRVKLFHPLPRGPEMSCELDPLPQAAYFRQARCGYPVTEAILHMMFS